ncbi:methionine aminopeptidase [Fistulina hepatica ATCC 64428]|nr:methionine aminopeptidase [Fistulina hepatica ATCC 64428]
MLAAVVQCQSAECLNGHPPSRFECPTCHKLGITGSFFCGQECFKAGCGCVNRCIATLNRDIENVLADAYNPFPAFEFTGSLRPIYPLSGRRTVPGRIPFPDYAIDGKPMLEMKHAGQPPRILNVDEIEKMRTVCRLAREVLDIAALHVKPGITTDALDEIVHNACVERNSYSSPLSYRGFPKSVCTSVNEVICHGIPDRRKLRDGDIVNIDVTLYHDGFHGDVNATYPVGDVNEGSKKLIRTTRKALDDVIAMCKPGVLFRDLGKVIEPVARTNGCSVVRTYTGHGINNVFHAAPTNIPHYAKNKAVGTMKPSMIFTIEPMINLGPNCRDVHWPDNWTATTVDGNRSAQFEETMLITETGVEVLTAGQPLEI